MVTKATKENDSKIAIHIIWLLAIINFLIGPSVVNWAKSQELAEQPNKALLDNITSEGKSYIDGLDESPEHGENRLKLWGWVFLMINSAFTEKGIISQSI